MLYLVKLSNVAVFSANLRRVFFRRQDSGRLYLVLQITFTVLVFTHYLSCGCYFVSEQVLRAMPYGDATSQRVWIVSNSAWSDIPALPVGWQYVYALYFGIEVLTTIAFGDIYPMNPYETVYVMFMYLMAVIWFVYIIEEVISVLIDSYIKRYEFNREVKEVDRFMEKRALDPALRREVLSHYEYLWNSRRYYQSAEKQLVQALSPVLRQNLLREVYDKYLQQLPLTRALGLRAVEQLSNVISELHVLPHHSLPVPPLAEPCLLFCEDLRYELLYQFPRSRVRVAKLDCREGLLGQYEFFMGQDSPYTYHSLRNTMLLRVTLTDVRLILRENDCYRLLLAERDRLLAGCFEGVGLRCPCCGAKEHLLEDCPSTFIQAGRKDHKACARRPCRRAAYRGRRVKLARPCFEEFRFEPQESPRLRRVLARSYHHLKQIEALGGIGPWQQPQS